MDVEKALAERVVAWSGEITADDARCLARAVLHLLDERNELKRRLSTALLEAASANGDCANLADERDGLLIKINDARTHTEAMLLVDAKQTAEVERQRSVLEWYADAENYDSSFTDDGIAGDRGTLARSALSPKRGVMP